MTIRRISFTGTHAGQITEALLLQCRRELDSVGYFYLADIPDGFDHERFVTHFGALVPQYGGELVWDLRPEEGMDDVYHSRNTRPLVPHTECYEFAGTPPRYLGLWCVQPAEGPGGSTTLADGYALLEQLSRAELDRLRSTTYRFTSSDGLHRLGLATSAEHPILDTRPDGGPILRFSYNNTVDHGDRFLPAFLDAVHAFFVATHRSITIERNAILLWDNHRMIHSRTGYSDRRRHLRRVLLDDRPSWAGDDAEEGDDRARVHTHATG